jgi:hypothetical protein
VKFHSLYTLKLDSPEWIGPRSRYCNLKKRPNSTHWIGGWGWAPKLFRSLRENKIPVFGRILTPAPASHFTDIATLAINFLFLNIVTYIETLVQEKIHKLVDQITFTFQHCNLLHCVQTKENTASAFKYESLWALCFQYFTVGISL